MDRGPLIVIGGPTAVGKSGFAVRLAERIGGSIVSADSMQVYRGMDIGTAKVSAGERGDIPHALLDVADPTEEFTVADYQPLAEAAIAQAYDCGRLPILVGGTGFYIQAVVRGIDFTGEEGTDEAFREEMQALEQEEGAGALYDRLQAVDPQSALLIHPHNRQRIVRALEYYAHTGRPFSEHNLREAQRAERYQTAFYVLTDDREKLYARIDRRAAEMVEGGLITEVIRLREDGVNASHQSMRSLGYRETMGALDALPAGASADDIDRVSLAEAIALHTRHYAKRQLTWFRREKDALWLSVSEHSGEEMIALVTDDLRERGILRES